MKLPNTHLFEVEKDGDPLGGFKKAVGGGGVL